MTTSIVVTNPIGNKDHVLVKVLEPHAPEGDRIRRMVRLEPGESQRFYGFEGVQITAEEIKCDAPVHAKPIAPRTYRTLEQIREDMLAKILRDARIERDFDKQNRREGDKIDMNAPFDAAYQLQQRQLRGL